MSFASGFFNSVDHDRLYDATDISRLFDGLIRDGIFASIGDCFVVKQSNQMNVTVGTGRAWFNHTWSYNDALYPVTIPPSEILMDRIDAIVLEINSVEAVRANSIKLIKGTPSSTPTKPALTNTKEVHQYPLAYVKVGKEVTSIRQADIENCVGTSVCPFVTGILEVISIEQLIPQWKDILNRFVEENTANFNTWMNGEKQDYQAWLAAAKKEIADWEATSKSDYQKWYDSIKNGYDQWFATIKAAYDANWSTFQQWEKSSQAEFDKWFENMKNKLEGDLGAKLTLETEKLGKEKVSLIESTKTDLTGTVEAPLMIGKATRNFMSSPIEQGDLTKDGAETPSDFIVRTAEFIPVDPDKKYMISFKGVVYVGVRTFDSSKAQISDSGWKGNNYIFSVENNCKYVRFVFNNEHNAITPSNISNIMLTTDLYATADDFVPYSGYDIKTVGKNLVNVDLPTQTKNGISCINNGDGTYTLNGTATADTAFALVTDRSELYKRIVGKNILFLNGGHKVSSNYRILFNVSTPDYIQWGSEKYDGDSFIVPSGYDLAVVDIHVKSGTTVNNLVVKPMLTTDLKATNGDYEPYTESTTHIDSSTEFPNFDLKAFDGATHIISPGNVQSFHADAPNGKYLLESIKKSAESGGVTYGPNAPTNRKVGDLWINTKLHNSLNYWNGTTWGIIESQILVSSNTPTHPYPGMVFYDPVTKKMYVYVAAGGPYGGPGWYHVGSDDPGGYYYGASAPANTKLLWIDTSGVARFYNGSAWTTLAATWG